jgi:inorganic pyrophosphatase
MIRTERKRTAFNGKLFKSGVLLACLTLPLTGFANSDLIAPSLTALDDYTLQANINFVADIEARDAEGNINVVIEIPKGTTGKWEVSADDATKLIWEFVDNKPRTIDYLGGYPANYGAVPQTAMPLEFGGDGEALDVIVLGEALARGSLAKVKVLGVLNLQEGNEYDGKLLGVVVGSKEAQASSWDELNKMMPGSVDTVSSWFSNYKGAGKLELKSIGPVDEALKIIDAASRTYAHMRQRNL